MCIKYNYMTLFLATLCKHCWCSGIMQDSHSCDPGSIPGQCTLFVSRHDIFLIICLSLLYFYQIVAILNFISVLMYYTKFFAL